MAANQNPIFTLTPNVGSVVIPTTNAQTKSDGTSAGSGADLMYNVWTSGAFGSFLEAIIFWAVANAAATSSVATVLRAYLSTVQTPGATTSSNTFLIGEVAAPVQSASHSTNPTNFIEMLINRKIPATKYIHVSQHVAQTTNQNYMATAIGGDY